MENVPIVVEGYLGWGNDSPPRRRRSSYQLWGPGGRWEPEGGHYIEDALEDAGMSEGATVVCVAFNRFAVSDQGADLLRQGIIEAIAAAAAGDTPTEGNQT